MADTEWEGLQTLLGTLKQVSPRATDFLRNEIIETTYEAFAESQRQVPVRYGILKGSGVVEIVSDDPIEVTISLRRGGGGVRLLGA